MIMTDDYGIVWMWWYMMAYIDYDMFDINLYYHGIVGFMAPNAARMAGKSLLGKYLLHCEISVIGC